jgi:hypothetical protein
MVCSLFRIEYPIVSIAIDIFVDQMMIHFAHKLTDNFHYWRSWFQYFAECIRKKLEEKCGLVYAPNEFRVCMFHDCTMVDCCRPGGGPVHPGGRDAPRHDHMLQRPFYTGYKKKHAIKYFTAELPNGMACYVYGPSPVTHSDAVMFTESHLNDLLRECQH